MSASGVGTCSRTWGSSPAWMRGSTCQGGAHDEFHALEAPSCDDVAVVVDHVAPDAYVLLLAVTSEASQLVVGVVFTQHDAVVCWKSSMLCSGGLVLEVLRRGADNPPVASEKFGLESGVPRPRPRRARPGSSLGCFYSHCLRADNRPFVNQKGCGGARQVKGRVCGPGCCRLSRSAGPGRSRHRSQPGRRPARMTGQGTPFIRVSDAPRSQNTLTLGDVELQHRTWLETRWGFFPPGQFLCRPSGLLNSLIVRTVTWNADS